MTLILDPSNFRQKVDELIQESLPGQQINKQYFAFTLPPQSYAHLPLKELLHTLPQATHASYDIIDNNSLTKENTEDADSKRLNARYHVRLKTTLLQNNKMDATLLNSIHTQLADQARQAPTDKKQGYDQILTYLTLIEDLHKQMQQEWINSTDPADKAMSDLPYIVDFYMDKQGRLIGLRQQIDYRLNNDNFMKIGGWLKVDYTQQPHFTIQSTPSNTYDLNRDLLVDAIMNAATD